METLKEQSDYNRLLHGVLIYFNSDDKQEQETFYITRNEFLTWDKLQVLLTVWIKTSALAH